MPRTAKNWSWMTWRRVALFLTCTLIAYQATLIPGCYASYFVRTVTLGRWHKETIARYADVLLSTNTHRAAVRQISPSVKDLNPAQFTNLVEFLLCIQYASVEMLDALSLVARDETRPIWQRNEAVCVIVYLSPEYANKHDIREPSTSELK